MDSSLKVAVIGAGNWGKNLVRNFHGLGALGAIAEANSELRGKLTKEYPGVQIYDDYNEVLKTEFPAVVIATPVATHYAVAREALLAGKDVFVEKPMTMSAMEAEELVQLADEKHRVLMVGHLLLYQPAIRFIKDYLDSGELGNIISLHQQRLNLGRVRTVENALWSLGVHDIAVLLHLVGENPLDVKTVGHCAIQPEIEDDVYLHLKFPGNIQAHLHSCWLWPEKVRRLTIIGSNGMLEFNELTQNVTLHRKESSLT